MRLRSAARAILVAAYATAHGSSLPTSADLRAAENRQLFWRYRRRGARVTATAGGLKLIAGAGLEPLPGAKTAATIAATFPGFNVVAFSAAFR